MKPLGLLLLIGVFARHDLTWLPGYSPQEWYYLLGGWWEVMLACAILRLNSGIPFLGVAMWIAALEGAQIWVCGALMGHERAPAGMNECDYLSGLPIGATLTALELILVAWVIGRRWRIL